MNSYSVYGLQIRSELVLPELQAGGDGSDVVIAVGKIADLPLSDRTGSWFNISPQAATLLWENVGAFQICEGREIQVDPAPGVADEMLRQALFGVAFTLLLQQRGYLPLHASAVEFDGQAIGLAGAAGTGKSTLAAALCKKGYPLISDDIAAVEIRTTPPRVCKGFPLIRLTAESLSQLGDCAADLPRVPGEVEKHVKRTEGTPKEDPLPLRRVYLIHPGTRTRIDRATIKEAVEGLIASSFQLELLQAALSPVVHMHLCLMLANKVPVFRLQRTSDLTSLDDLARIVEEHVAVSP